MYVVFAIDSFVDGNDSENVDDDSSEWTNHEGRVMIIKTSCKWPMYFKLSCFLVVMFLLEESQL